MSDNVPIGVPQATEIESTGEGPVATKLAEQARAAAKGGSEAELKEAAAGANPDQRSAAAKELADDTSAYEALHRALEELDAQQ